MRKWLDKDLNDLKSLIELVVHWINAECLSEELEASMPEHHRKAPPGRGRVSS